jgi:hypothetical protein
MILGEYECKKNQATNSRMLACDFIGLVRDSIKNFSRAIKASRVYIGPRRTDSLERQQQDSNLF